MTVTMSWDHVPIFTLCYNLFPADSYPIAKEFWQHTGQGISSRLAEKCLSLWPSDSPSTVQRPTPGSSRFPSKGHNWHYSVDKVPCSPKSDSPSSLIVENLSKDHSVYLEERYGRKLLLAAAASAKRVLLSRVAGILKENSSIRQTESYTEQKDLLVGPSTRGVAEVAVDDVYLYPTGSAIWNAHNMALAFFHLQKAFVWVSLTLPPLSIADGLFADRFPYTDTVKFYKYGDLVVIS